MSIEKRKEWEPVEDPEDAEKMARRSKTDREEAALYNEILSGNSLRSKILRFISNQSDRTKWKHRLESAETSADYKEDQVEVAIRAVKETEGLGDEEIGHLYDTAQADARTVSKELYDFRQIYNVSDASEQAKRKEQLLELERRVNKASNYENAMHFISVGKGEMIAP